MGRVQWVAVKLICEREREREAFRPEEYWTITATLAGKHPPPFEAKLHSVNGREADISTAPEAERIVAAVRGKTFIVQAIERKEKKRNPVAPFIASRLQQEAARKLRFSPKKTMTLAQQLYEGVDIGKEGPTGLITYMRTDSTRIAREAAEEARQLIRERFGSEYLPATLNVFKTQKAAQDGQPEPGLTPKQPFTKPQPRYNEALLIKELEEKGIGRPSTYASITATIQERRYVEKVDGRFAPAETGITVNDFLVKGFPDILDVDFTSLMEKELDEVEEGEKQWVAAVRDFYLPFSKDIEKAKHLPGPKDTVQPPTNIPCEKCGRMMEIKWGRNGKFLACPGYKEDPPCKNTQNFERLPDGTIKIVAKQEVATDEKCEKCGSPMVIKSGRFGKFLACSAYPTCKNTKPLPLGVKCPKDGGDLTQKRSKKGRTFYACTNYPKCDFALWDRPVAKPCPQCRAPFLVEKYSKQTGTSLVCRNDECGYKE